MVGPGRSTCSSPVRFGHRRCHMRAAQEPFPRPFVPFAEFEEDARNGTLPDFSLIEPNLLAGHADYHPPFGDAMIGASSRRRRTSSVLPVSAFWPVSTVPCERTFRGRSNVWNTTLFVGWDEPGGTYDHVPPARCRSPGPIVRSQLGFAFDRSGYRVPAVMVSPWVPPRSVFTDDYRHTSLMATLRRDVEPGRAVHGPRGGRPKPRAPPQHGGAPTARDVARCRAPSGSALPDRARKQPAGPRHTWMPHLPRAVRARSPR